MWPPNQRKRINKKRSFMKYSIFRSGLYFRYKSLIHMVRGFLKASKISSNDIIN